MSDFQIRLRRRGITPQEILDDIRRVARERGTATVTRLEYDQYGQFGATTALRNFKTWNVAVQAAGLCGDSPAKNPDAVLHVDHILPWSKGGETVEENLQTLCSVCNIGKSDLIVER